MKSRGRRCGVARRRAKGLRAARLFVIAVVVVVAIVVVILVPWASVVRLEASIRAASFPPATGDSALTVILGGMKIPQNCHHLEEVDGAFRVIGGVDRLQSCPERGIAIAEEASDRGGGT